MQLDLGQALLGQQEHRPAASLVDWGDLRLHRQKIQRQPIVADEE
ncbi:hypothetical protein [Nitrincola sp. MINF-07-Sa-05]